MRVTNGEDALEVNGHERPYEPMAKLESDLLLSRERADRGTVEVAVRAGSRDSLSEP